MLCKGRFAGPISGADETLVTYATQLQAHGQRVSVTLLYPHGENDPYYLRLREAGVTVTSVARDSRLRALLFALRGRLTGLPGRPRRILQRTAATVSTRYLAACKEFFAAAGVDVVHVVTPDPASMTLIRAAHAAGVPVLYQELGTSDYLPELELYYQQLRAVLPLCRELAALSPHLARRFAQKFDCSTPGVLPLMVADSGSRAAITTAVPGVRFGFCARLEYGKGPLVLLEAFELLQRMNGGRLQLYLDMAGAGIEEARVRESVAARGLAHCCHLAGPYNGPLQRARWMNAIDVLVLPSLAEGTPNSIIEAMSHGLPIVASAVGGIPDVVGGECGILVPAGDSRALAEAMLKLADDAELRRQAGQAARRRYEDYFAPARVLPLLVATYQRLGAGGGAVSGAVSSAGAAM